MDVRRKTCALATSSRAILLVAAVAALAAPLTGCAGNSRASTLEDPSAVFPTLDQSRASSDCAGDWSVLLRLFAGPDAMPLAQAYLQQVRAQAGLSDARIERRDQGVAVLTGSFHSPSDPAAQRALARIRALRVGQAQPFARAVLLPPSASASEGSLPQWSLTRVRRERGPDELLYTLQIAVYESDNPAQACAAAEQAVAALRADGVEAWYHHGLGRSVVTVGIFTARDYDPQRGRLSPRLQEAMRAHPHNLYNGRTLREKGPDGRWREQPSVLVLVP